MPIRQETFKLVPTTLVNTTGPRPPMTSKAAKKAYREATKIPKISKAEERRIAAEEIARQKKEYEKERAAAKAKVAREKKLKKEREEREQRKKLRLPEPSRFVRASQPTIQRFVKTGTGGKRSWQEMDDMIDDGGDNGREQGNGEFDNQQTPPAKLIALQQPDGEDEFGDFPCLSQRDFPGLLGGGHGCQKRAPNVETSQTATPGAFPKQPPRASPTLHPQESSLAGLSQPANDAELDAEMSESQLLAEALAAARHLPLGRRTMSPVATPEVLSNALRLRVLTHSNSPYSAILRPRTENKPPTTVNMKSSRTPLQEISRNMPPPPLPPRFKPATSRSISPQVNKLSRQPLVVPPPSTLAFLEAHLDLFPSSSQQARELLEDIDDMPSNTQVAREIDLKPDLTTVQAPLTQPQLQNEGLNLISSQDFELSSQDLRDINTPRKAVPADSIRPGSTDRDLGLARLRHPPPPSLKPKPRFFEEKEDDLFHAALHESLLMANQKTPLPSPRGSQKNFRRAKSTKSDYEDDDFGFGGSEMDPDFLAVLDQAERGR